MNKFHPSFFENNRAVPSPTKNTTTQDPTQDPKFSKNVVSPGRYNMTTDDSIAVSNEKYVFRNLYGETLFTAMFFSSQNIDNIQKLIKFVVHRETGYTIDKQSYNELLIVMRSVFLDYGSHPKLISDKMSEKEKMEIYPKYTREVERLNEFVINSVVPKLVTQMKQYIVYLKDSTEQPYTMDTPTSDSIAGQREYRSITQVLTGGQL